MIIVWSILCIAMIIFNIIVCRKVVKIENTVAYTAASVFA